MPTKSRARARSAPANGHALTAKNLPKSLFRVIHSLPYGHRQDALHGLLKAAHEFAAGRPDWYKQLAAGTVRLVQRRD